MLAERSSTITPPWLPGISAVPATASSSLTIQKAPARSARSTTASPIRISAVRSSGSRSSRRPESGIARGLTAILTPLGYDLLHVVLQPVELPVHRRRLRPGKPAGLYGEDVALGAVELAGEAFERRPDVAALARRRGRPHVRERSLEVGPPACAARREPALDEADRHDRDDQDEGAEDEEPCHPERDDGEKRRRDAVRGRRDVARVGAEGRLGEVGAE